MLDLECYRDDAYVLLYSVSEPESFTVAVSLLHYLRHELGTDRTIFLVANKSDLVRQRLVSSKGKLSLCGVDFLLGSDQIH